MSGISKWERVITGSMLYFSSSRTYHRRTSALLRLAELHRLWKNARPGDGCTKTFEAHFGKSLMSSL